MSDYHKNSQGYNHSLNDCADYWRFDIGANVFPCDSRKKVTYEHWKQWQDKPISLDQHESWKEQRAFDQGIMAIPGKPWHRPDKISFNLTCIEWDRELGRQELFPEKSLDEICNEHFIEQHLDDLTRGHIWIYSPIVFPTKNADDILGLEIKSLGSHGVMIVHRSIHKNGHPIELTGTQKPRSLTKDEAFELLLHIDKVCKKHTVPYLDKNENAATTSLLSNDMKRMIKNLTIDSDIEINNGTRHDTLLSVANSILFRHSKTKNHEKLETYFGEVNEKLCKPEPLPEKEASEIWTNALEFVFRVQEQEQEQEKQYASNSKKQAILQSISNETIKSMLGTDIWTLISENPLKFIVAHRSACHICRASVSYTESGSSSPVKKAHLNYGAILIRLYPKRVILHENPLKFLEASPRYTIIFEDQSTRNIVVSGTIDGIISKLKEMPGYVISSYGITEALTAIIGAFSDDMELEIDRTVDFEGYYYHDGDIQISRINLEEKHPRRTKQEVLECIEYLEKRSQFQVWDYKGRTIDRRDLLASAIKWMIPAPFNFALKQQNCPKPYLKGFDMSGERDGGKSGLSEEMLNMHGNLTNEQDADSIYSKSAGSANTEAKFAKALCSTTYAVEFSEFGRLEAYGRREDLVESCKTSIDGLIIRRGKKDNRTDAPFPSLSPMIVNGNSVFTSKGELLKRFHVTKFSEEDRHDRDANSPFNMFQREKKHLLKILGDWTMRYILDNKQELLLSRKYNPYQIGEIALKEFYRFADSEIPEWLTRWIVDTSLEELDQDIEEIIRSILYNHVHKTLRENSNLIIEEAKKGYEIKMHDRIRLCLESDTWSWIRKIRGSELKYYVNTSIMELFANRLPELTFKKLAEKTGFKYVKDTEGKAKILCTKKELYDFIVIESEDEVKTGG